MWLYLMIPLFVLVLGALIYRQRRAQAVRRLQTEFADLSRCTAQTRTPAGATVRYVSKCTAAMMQAIDAGLSRLFVRAARHGYTQKLAHSDYTVYLLPPDREFNAAGEYVPAFKVAPVPPAYAGTEFDLGGFMFNSANVPEVLLQRGEAGLVLLEQDRDLALLTDTADYEGEHCIFFFNDRSEFMRTLDHVQYPHPVLN